MARPSQSSESIFLSLLTVLFIGLKLTGYIDWAWYLVLGPILFPAALAIVLIGAYAFYLIVIKDFWKKVRKVR